MDVNKKIQSYVTDRKFMKRKRPLHAVLSLLVTICVISNLITPAISMTIEEAGLGIFSTETASTETTVKPGTPATISGTSMLDITSADTWTASMSSGGVEIYVAYVDDNGIVNTPVKGGSTVQDPMELEVAIDYSFGKANGDAVKALLAAAGTGPHLGWYMGNSSLTADFGDQQIGEIYDGVYNEAKGHEDPAGTYVIEDGYIKITLTSAYLEYVNAGDGSLVGSLRFDGLLSRSDNENGDQSFTMAGQTVSIAFPDRYAKINSKTATVKDQNGTIEWTVVIENAYKVDMSDYTLTDDMLANATSVSVNPSDAATYTSGSSTIGFTSASANAQWITIKYTTAVTKDQMNKVDGSASNTATLKKADDEESESTGKADADFTKEPITIEKKGKPDYETGTYNHEINWTVTVTNNYGVSLDGYIIQDPKLTADAVVSPSGTLTSAGDNKWTLDTNASSVTITYTTSAVDGLNENTAKVFYPDGSAPTEGGTSDADVTYKKESELFGMEKRHELKSDGTILWTVVVQNTYKVDLTNYKLTDKMLQYATSVNFSPAVGTFDDATDTISFTADAKDQQWITITYSTPITDEQLKNETDSRSNTVEMKDEEGNTIRTDDETANFDQSSEFVVGKSAAADYENGSQNGFVTWTVTITSKYGTSLDDYIISDTMLAQALEDTLTVSPSGSLTLVSSNADSDQWKLSGTNGAKTVTITYQTLAEEGKTYSNTASLFYPDGDPADPDGDTDTATEEIYYKKQSELVSLGKDGQYDKDAHAIQWTVKVNVEGNYSLNGYTVEDDLFGSLQLSDITFEPEAAATGATLEGNVLTFGDYTGSVTLKYTQIIDIPENQSTTSVSNTVGHEGSTVVATVPVDIRNTLTKTSNQYSVPVTNNALIERTLSWTSEITLDGSFEGKVYEDTLKMTGDGTHTITDAQLAAIKVYARTTQYGGQTLLTAGTDETADYIVARTDNGFKITFNKSLDEKGYNYLTINYSTTATANAPAANATYPITYTYGNSAAFNGNTDADNDFTLTRNNPESRTELNLTVEKAWQNDTESERAASVTTKILYKVNGSDEWYYLRGTDGAFLYYGDEGYDSASDYVVTLNSANGWKLTVNGLHKAITKADENGNSAPTVYYYYKIEEVTPEGKTIENSLYKTENGFYQVSYTTNHGINYDGTIKVTNTFHRNTAVQPKKNWTGDTGSGTGFDSVTVQLEYSTDGGTTRYPVKTDADGNYIFDGGGTTEGATIVTEELLAANEWIGTGWSGLPTIIVVNGEAKSCTYRISETAVTESAAEGETANVITVSGTKFVVDNGYYNVSNSVGSDGTLTVTNEFKKTVTYTIGAVKTWAGDVNNADSRPEILILQLQQQPKLNNNWGTWADYGEPVEISAAVGSDWSHAFTGLPNQSVAEDGTVTDYRYRVLEVGYKMTADGTAVMFPANTLKYATDENGVYEMTYTGGSIDYGSGLYVPNVLDAAGIIGITNTFTPVATLDLTPQKKWTGDTGYETSDRPQSVTFTLQRSIGYNGTWKNVTDDNGNVVTVTLQNDANTTTTSEWVWTNGVSQEVVTTLWNGTTKYGLPAETVVQNPADGTYTKQTCYYRFVETSYVSATGTNTAIGSSDDSFSTTNGKYDITISSTYNTGTLTVTNAFTKAVGITKYAIDENGNKLPETIEIEDLEQFKDGDYYVFNWMIEYDLTNWGDGDKLPTVKDHLPDDFELVYDNSWVGTKTNTSDPKAKYDKYWYTSSGAEDVTWLLNYYNQSKYLLHPAIIYPQNGYACGAMPSGSIEDIYEVYMHAVNYDNPDLWYYYDEANNDVYFNKYKATAPAMIYYAVRIKCSDLEAKIANSSHTIKNTAYTYDDESEDEENRKPILDTVGALKIVNPIDTNLITKSYSQTKIPGIIQYSLNINPEGKNLSSGTTIDIQDLFETVSYTDSDYQNGEITTGKKLVDVLMNSIKLYKVDANGNKIALNSSEYSMMFQTGADVSNGAALMKLTIPDETHIVVDYTYKLIANEITPSVIHGCKSSTRVNGRYVTMAPGLVPPAGDIIEFSNTASLISDSAESSDTEANTKYEVSKSSGTISTNALPSIKKVNTGDYSINNLEATFLLAKYENGKWYYVNSAEVVDADEGEYDITWSLTGADGTRISDDAARIEIKANADFKAALDQNVLYKLVEIVVPKNYEGSNLGLSEAEFEEMIRAYLNDGATIYNEKDYSIFLKHYISTHYFTYNSAVSTYPDGVTANDVIQVKSGSDVEIPNNKLIDIDVKKTWVNPISDVTGAEITLELYWSYTKDTTGIPEDAVLAKAEDLGIMDESFSAQRTITVGDTAVEDVWTDLPNGTGKKPIYYYIKETAYTIGGTTYTLDEETNTYKSTAGEAGAYLPTYTGNAANDDAEIGVKNSYQLMLKKEWKNSSNVTMKNLPVDGVVVSIYGIDQDNVQTENPLFEDIELSVANNWTADLTSLLTNVDLSQYKAFVAVENENPDLEGYVVSCVFNLNAQTGEIIVTNKNTVPTEASVTVNKNWSDGNDLHAAESIDVTLYQTQTELADLTDLASKLTLIGAQPMEPTETYKVTLNAENEWTYTWTGLPLEDEAQNKYYYYVLEDMSNVADAKKYTATYVVTDKTTTKTEYTVRNYRNAFVVKKQWYSEDGTLLEDDALTVDSITLDVLKEVATVPEDGLDIVALGDSITRGGYNNVAESSRYPQQLQTILGTTPYSYSNVTVISQGSDGQQIPSFENRLGDINSDTDIVCVLGGTNDIHQDGSTREITVIRDRMVSLISKIKEKNANIIIIIGSIPHFDFVETSADDSSWKYTTSATWWGGSNTSWTKDEWQAFEDTCNKRIDDYNALLKTLAEETENVYFADVCAAVNKDTMLYSGDGCHPNADGYKAIAETYAAAIHSIYNVSAKVTEVTLSKDNNWMAAVDIDDTDTSIEYYVDETNVPAGWTVTYSGTPQTVGSSTPIIVTNTKYTPKTDVSVEKFWENDESDTTLREDISLALMRSTDCVNWVEVDMAMPTPTKSEDGNTWTYQYEDLPAEDTTGLKYYYKVVEDPLDGYTVTYANEWVESVADGDAGSLRLTNTRQMTLKLQKLWAGVDETELVGKSVTIRIHRTTVKSGVPTDKDLILQVISSVAIGVGKTQDVAANKKITAVSTSNEEVAKVTLNEDGTITIEGVSDGTATVTVSDGKDSVDISVIVSALEMFLNGGTTFKVEAGSNDAVLTAEKSGTEVAATFTVKEGAEYISINGATITALALGEAVVVAEYEGLTIEQTIEVVLPSTFSIMGESEVTIGKTIDLDVDKNYGTFTWSSSNEAAATVNEDGVVTGIAEATDVKITATRNDGETAEFLVDVVNGDIFENENAVIKVYVGESVELESSVYIQQMQNYDGNIVEASTSNGKLTIKGKAAGTTTATVKGGSSWEKTTTITIIVSEKFVVNPATKTLAYGGTVTLTPNKEGTVEYTITSGANLIEISGNTVTAKSGTEGTAVITAKNTTTNETATVTIEVVAEITTISGQFVDNKDTSRIHTYEYDPATGLITIQIVGGGTYQDYHINDIKRDENLKNLIPTKYELTTTSGTSAYLYGPGTSWSSFIFNNGVGTFDASSNNTSFANCTSNIGIYSDTSTPPFTLKIYVKTTEAASANLLSNASFLSSAVSNADSDIAPLAEDDWYMDVELVNTAGQNWQATVTLDVCDSDGTPYYYWAEELVVPTGYEVSYQFDDGDEESGYWINPAQPNENGEFNVTVRNTKVKESSVELPSTGGRGTAWNYGIGMMIILGSAAGYFLIRRRQKDESK